MRHAVVEISHEEAHLVRFDSEHHDSARIKTHGRRTPGSAVRAEHELFGEVCDALAETPEILVTGSKTAVADFKHYVEKHRSALAPNVIGYETTNHPTENQLLALARTFALKHDQLDGTAPI